MRWRGKIKKAIYGNALLRRRGFPYFGTRVYFPAASHLFIRACQEGIYEHETVSLLTSLARPHTTYFDVGANIGLLSIPLLAEYPDLRVVSIEASPKTARYLRQTQARSPFQGRWDVVECAVGCREGEAAFFAGPEADGAFDGLADTGRGGAKTQMQVMTRSLDGLWREAGAPHVSVVKIDVEGGEAGVLRSAAEMLSHAKPAVVTEWSGANLAAYRISPEDIIEICRSFDYDAFSYPNVFRIDSPELLRVAMRLSETLLLLPKSSQASSRHALPPSR